MVKSLLNGTLVSYYNGTSTLSSGIWGATLTIGVLGDPSITPAVIRFLFIGTQNGNISRELDADILQFSTPLNLQFHVYEGAQASATITGRIVGDPVLKVDGVELVQWLRVETDPAQPTAIAAEDR